MGVRFQMGKTKEYQKRMVRIVAAPRECSLLFFLFVAEPKSVVTAFTLKNG